MASDATALASALASIQQAAKVVTQEAERDERAAAALTYAGHHLERFATALQMLTGLTEASLEEAEARALLMQLRRSGEDFAEAAGKQLHAPVREKKLEVSGAHSRNAELRAATADMDTMFINGLDSITRGPEQETRPVRSGSKDSSDDDEPYAILDSDGTVGQLFGKGLAQASSGV